MNSRCCSLVAAILTVFAVLSARAEQPALFSTPLAAFGKQDTFWQVASRLEQLESLAGRFEQEKRIAVLKKPLISKGTFRFTRQDGMLWKIEDPFAATLVFSKDGIFEQQEDGSFIPLLPERQAVVAGFSRLLLAVFSGERDVLEKNFEVFFEGNPDRWTIGLKPKDRMLGRFIVSLLLSGRGEEIEQLVVAEANGDQARIRFSEVKSGQNAK